MTLPPAATIDRDLVAVSLLKPDTSTEVARLLKELVDEMGGRAVLADAARSPAILAAIASRLRLGAPRVVDARAWANQLIDRGGERGLGWLPAGGTGYPDRLWQIPDPPPALWLRGERSDALGEPAVAVVGARDATPAGLRVAERLARELAEAGLVVVSGLARGIDGAAHRGALAGGGRTVAVLGCGADLVYPREHTELAGRIAEAGVLVSECAPGALPLPFRFPLRNRIISGLSRAVVVIEASDRSGSLITARAALEQGRDVLAVPGSIASGRYRGGHALIKDGARLVETVEDVLEEIGWSHVRQDEADKSLKTSELEVVMAAGESYTLDELAQRTGWSAARLLAELATLELDGKLTRSDGGNFVKT